MAGLDKQILYPFVNTEIVRFHQTRLSRLQGLKLNDVLRKKNPYLFRAKNIQVAAELVGALMNAFLSSSEEEMFGAFLEELAIFVSEQTSGGRKSTATGLDLEFDRADVRYLVAIKSGPNWGNKSQYDKLQDNFRAAIKVQRQSHRAMNVQAVLGMCYGKSPAYVDTGGYVKMAGQCFWHFLSQDADLYTDIIEPIGFEAKRHNEDFEASRAAIQNRLTAELTSQFCDEDFSINWSKLVAFNSGNMAPVQH